MIIEYWHPGDFTRSIIPFIGSVRHKKVAKRILLNSSTCIIHSFTDRQNLRNLPKAKIVINEQKIIMILFKLIIFFVRAVK